MRIEIFKRSRKKLSNVERQYLQELISWSINTYCLISEENEGTIVIECVPEAYVEKLKNIIEPQYEIKVKEDRFMAQIDLMDLLNF